MDAAAEEMETDQATSETVNMTDITDNVGNDGAQATNTDQTDSDIFETAKEESTSGDNEPKSEALHSTCKSEYENKCDREKEAENSQCSESQVTDVHSGDEKDQSELDTEGHQSRTNEMKDPAGNIETECEHELPETDLVTSPVAINRLEQSESAHHSENDLAKNGQAGFEIEPATSETDKTSNVESMPMDTEPIQAANDQVSSEIDAMPLDSETKLAGIAVPGSEPISLESEQHMSPENEEMPSEIAESESMPLEKEHVSSNTEQSALGMNEPSSSRPKPNASENAHVEQAALENGQVSSETEQVLDQNDQIASEFEQGLLKSESVPPEDETLLSETDPSSLESEPVDIENKELPLETEPTSVEPEPMCAEPELNHVERDSDEKAQSDNEPIESENQMDQEESVENEDGEEGGPEAMNGGDHIQSIEDIEKAGVELQKRIEQLDAGVKAIEEANTSLEEMSSAVSTMLESELDVDVTAESGVELADEQAVQDMISKAFKELGIADILDAHVAEQMDLVGQLEREAKEVRDMFAQCRVIIDQLRDSSSSNQHSPRPTSCPPTLPLTFTFHSAEERPRPVSCPPQPLTTCHERVESAHMVSVQCQTEPVDCTDTLDRRTQAQESDSDDDVQFVTTTYTAPKLTLQEQLKMRLPPHLRSVVQVRQCLNEKGERVIYYSIPQNTPNQEQLRQELLRLRTPAPQNLRSLVNPQVGRQPVKYPDPVEGMKLYGKKHNDIWYKGTLVEVQNRERPVSERRYKLKFDGKGMKLLIAKHIAFNDYPPEVLPVGSRIIALYRDDEGSTSYYAGIVAEPPSVKNAYRYLIFFDDGYAQYSSHKEIHKVVEQSVNVWEDTYEDSRSFIQGYLKQYPERPMVRLQPGQKVKTEWGGKWWLARVIAVDASLVKMQFETDHRTLHEWIYRGSTRLEPLYTELAQQEKLRQRGLGVSRRHFNPNKRKHVVEYLSAMPEAPADGEEGDDDSKKKSVARKSTAKKNTGKGDIASVLQERLSQDTPEANGAVRRVNNLKSVVRRKFTPHKCSQQCVAGMDVESHMDRNTSCLHIPQLCGFERRQCWQKMSNMRRSVVYRAPCGRMLRSIAELDEYLHMTDSKLTIDMFCYDSALRTDTEFVSIKTFCDIKDLSYGKENVNVSCVNGWNRQYPEYVEYSTERVPGRGVNLGNSADFRVCCDCTDGCRDYTKCACIQLTIEASQIPSNETCYGYQHRRLTKQVPTGVFECNAGCKCDQRCANRVVQRGLRHRLQVFRTEKKGWGVRSLNDIPAGTYICVFTGKVLDENEANEDGQQFGDEYLAELDYIETVEQMKEGYESDVVVSDDDQEKKQNKPEDNMTESDDGHSRSDDSFSATDNGLDSDCSVGKIVDRQLGINKRSRRNRSNLKTDALPNKVAASELIAIDCSDDEEQEGDKEKKDSKGDVSGDLAGLCITEPTSLNTDNVSPDSDDEDKTQTGSDSTKAPRGPRRSTRQRPTNMPDPKQEEEAQNKKPVTLRSYYSEEFCYVMDAKSKGNIGRYLNHGCDPNVFVQNVFVDSHDLRFPWVAFFAERLIKAGAELTWDYNYEVGSVAGKTLYCYCGSSECRGRLL